MKPYPSYEDSGVEWVGKIPAGWDLLKPKYHLNKVEREPLPNDEIVTCFRDGVVTLRRHRRTTGFTNSLKEIGYQRIHKGDLVVHEMDGFEGSIGVSDSDGKSTPVYTIIERSDKYDVRYWMYVLREMSTTGFIESLSRSIRERTTEFRWKMWRELYFAVPPLPEQQQISNYLDQKTKQIDELIEKTKQKIELLKEKRTSLINHCVTKGLDPNMEMKDSGLEWVGKIPNGWKVEKIKYIFWERKEMNDPIKTNNLISLTLEKGVIPHSEKGTGGNKPKDDISKYKLVYPGDIVLNSMNVIVGSVGLSNYFGVVSPVYYMLIPSDKNDDVTYFHHMFRGEMFQKSLIGLGNGILIKHSETSGKSNTIRMRIPMSKLNQERIPYPPKKEQQQISNYLDQETKKIDTLVEKENKRIEFFKEYRQSLISEVVTGKIDVRDEVIQ
jgi:type I restriction enzyme, S subunit